MTVINQSLKHLSLQRKRRPNCLFLQVHPLMFQQITKHNTVLLMLQEVLQAMDKEQMRNSIVQIMVIQLLPKVTESRGLKGRGAEPIDSRSLIQTELRSRVIHSTSILFRKFARNKVINDALLDDSESSLHRNIKMASHRN